MTARDASDPQRHYWNSEAGQLMESLGSSDHGLTTEEALKRLGQYGENTVRASMKKSTISLLLGQFKSPIILILIAAAVVSLFVGDRTDATIILVIVLFSGLLGFWQEKGAQGAVARLLEVVKVRSVVVRDRHEGEVPVEEVVPGDIIRVSAGSVVPADSRILYSKHLYVDEAMLTGETFPVEKETGVVMEDAPLAERTNVLFMGTHVVSGEGTALAVRTGLTTEFGKISLRLKERPEETEFERGIRRFGYFLVEITLLLVIVIFAVNIYLKKPPLDSFLFSLALAVGLTPQLLPAIITINLSKGAKTMANRKVIVKRLASIENLGSMDVFCCDKTGTLTEGKVSLRSAEDIEGNESARVKLLASLNSVFQTGFVNPIDEAIRESSTEVSGYEKLDEVPYDFKRRRLTVAVRNGDGAFLITKGATDRVLEVCESVEKPGGSVDDLAGYRDAIIRRYEELGQQGIRTLGVAYKEIDSGLPVTQADERGLVFLGIITLFDPPKAGIEKTLKELARLGISLKIITGDNRLVAESVGRQVGLQRFDVLTGSEINSMSDAALSRHSADINIFAEVEPSQKERIVRSLIKAGHTVGYMGDGINDAPALHAADVSLSVDTAVDVAKEAADFVLLEKDLWVLADGVREGRATFANTMKYVFMATSANFGNMFSMAGASLFLKFLPLLPGQVLLTNLLTDLPEMTIATDSVDLGMIEKPRRMEISFIRKFMLAFGLLSSVFDYATFAVLLWVLNANVIHFRTGWFLESVVSASMIVLVIRTRQSFFKSMPSRYLLGMTILVAAVTIAIPYTPLAGLLGFKPVPALFHALLFGILVSYVAAAEITKKLFYKWVN